MEGLGRGHSQSIAASVKLILNGEAREFKQTAMQLDVLLGQIGFAEKPVLVEHNGVAIHQRDYPSTALAEGDRLEIILIVAGG